MSRLRRVGVGTYRMNQNHENALRHALKSGFTTIDTAPNYELGVSQQLIGNVMRDYNFKRDDFRICSKVGILQGPAFDEMKKADQLPTDMVPLGGSDDPDFGGFSLDPNFMEAQLSHSLRDLQSDYLDIYFLHNPEMLLKREPDSKESENQKLFNMYDKVRQAFQHLESEVSKGRIRGYGVSSNVFARSDAWLDPERFLKIAKEVGGENHNFKAVQFPLNIVEKSKLDDMIPWCKTRRIEAIINRPLNAFYEGEIYRLTSPISDTTPATLQEIEESRDAILKYAAEKKYDYLVQFVHQLWASGDEFIHNNVDWRIELEQWMDQYSNIGGIDQEGMQILAKFVLSFCEFLEYNWLQKGPNLVKDKLKMQFDGKLQDFALKWLLENTDATILIGMRKLTYVEAVSTICQEKV